MTRDDPRLGAEALGGPLRPPVARVATGGEQHWRRASGEPEGAMGSFSSPQQLAVALFERRVAAEVEARSAECEERAESEDTSTTCPRHVHA